MTEIKIDDIEIILKKILEKIRFEFKDNIILETSHYSLISSETWNKFTDFEVEFHSLIDDIEWLKKLANKNRICSFVDFDRMSSVLRAISQERNPIT